MLWANKHAVFSMKAACNSRLYPTSWFQRLLQCLVAFWGGSANFEVHITAFEIAAMAAEAFFFEVPDCPKGTILKRGS